jgi:hypothetical protein
MAAAGIALLCTNARVKNLLYSKTRARQKISRALLFPYTTNMDEILSVVKINRIHQNGIVYYRPELPACSLRLKKSYQQYLKKRHKDIAFSIYAT